MINYNPSLLIDNWKKLSAENKIDFLDCIVSELESGEGKYNIFECYNIFELTVFLNTEKVNIIKENKKVYAKRFSKNDIGSNNIISDNNSRYVLKLLAKFIIEHNLDWKEAFKEEIKEPIDTNNLFERYFYENYLKKRKDLVNFIMENEKKSTNKESKYFLYIDIIKNFYELENNREVRTDSTEDNKKIGFDSLEELISYLKEDYGTSLLDFKNFVGSNDNDVSVSFNPQITFSYAENTKDEYKGKIEENHYIYIEKHDEK